MGRLRDPAKTAKKLIANLSNSTDAVREGVMAVTEAPGKKAVANKAGYLAGIQRGLTKWETNLGNYPLNKWKDDMIKKGVDRIATGIANAEPKLVDFYSQMKTYLDGTQSTIDSMPSVTQDNKKQRMLANYERMLKFKYNKKY